MSAPTRFNKAGRPIWFVAQRAEGGVYTPVTAEGRRAFILALVWIIGGGTIFPILMVITFDWRWLAVMFACGGAGLAKFALTVIRHS